MRHIEPINSGWHFTGRDHVRIPVTLPHTWNHLDGQDGGNNYYRGTCVYDCLVRKPVYTKDERVYLQFHGVNSSAKVTLNGQMICEHDGGYSTFRVDVTEYLQDENMLVVEVDNGANDRVYPQKADFTFYGGIYRDVEFLVVNQRHFELDYFGGIGLKYETRIDGNDAEICVSTYKNELAEDTVTHVTLCDANGVIVAQADIGADDSYSDSAMTGQKTACPSLRVRLDRTSADSSPHKADNISKISTSSIVSKQQEETTDKKRFAREIIYEKNRTGEMICLDIKNVHLWDGLRDPYLYTLKATLLKDGTPVDEVTCKAGFRAFHFSPKDGFHLNGKPYPLHGVSRHQDFRGIGNAVSRQEHDRDMDMIREVGANAIRLAHYQHDQYFYDLCDKYGMIVWAEIPYISEHLANGDDNTISQMMELIVQNYNHPSIVTWGISNEITISGRARKQQMLANHRTLNDLCHEMDKTRPTSLACFAMCPHWHPAAHITDLVGWNLYLGWYVPFLWLNDLWIRFWHLLYPKRCLCYSEYGAEGMPNLHSDKPKRGDNTEEYQTKYHEYMLECFKRHPYLWGYFYWNMFDFAADARNQGGDPGMNHKGMVTFDRKLKKDVFYLYQAYWTDEPMVHLAGKRYEYRTEAVTDITVYSNLKEVSLYNNGKLIETKQGNHVFRFRMNMEDTNRLEVKAGALSDKAVIYKTDKPKPEYKLKKGDSSNWM